MAIKISVLSGALYNRAISAGIGFNDICNGSGLSRTVVNKILNYGWYAKISTLTTLKLYFESAGVECPELDEIISMYKKKDGLIELIKETNFNNSEISRMEAVINLMLVNNNAGYDGDDDGDAGYDDYDEDYDYDA